MEKFEHDVPRPTRRGPDIPFEISRSLAQHLDLKSAFNLSLTCKSLRDAGECRLYAAIDLTERLGLDENNPVREFKNADFTIIGQDLKARLEALGSYPLRVECVNSLIIPSVPVDMQDKLHRLLELVQPHLDVLGFISSAIDGNTAAPDFKHIVRKYTSWPKLHTIRLATPNAAELVHLCVLLDSCRVIRNLELCWTDTENSFEADRPVRDAIVPDLPNITHLSLCNFSHLYFAPALLAKTPNLQDFTMRGYRPYEGPDERGLSQALKKLEHLKRTNWLTDLSATWYSTSELRHLKALEEHAEVMEQWEDEHFELDTEVSIRAFWL
jgi:hypothetical protein